MGGGGEGNSMIICCAGFYMIKDHNSTYVTNVAYDEMNMGRTEGGAK